MDYESRPRDAGHEAPADSPVDEGVWDDRDADAGEDADAAQDADASEDADAGEDVDAAACPCEADLNGDGTVDSSDLGALLPCFGKPPEECGSWPAADIDCDGDVDQQDVDIFLAQWNDPPTPDGGWASLCE